MSKMGMTMMLANRNRSNRVGSREGQAQNEMQNNNGNMRNEMRGGYDQMESNRGGQMRSEMRGGYGMESNYGRSEMEMGGMESRFRDRRGREHYDNGRFAPQSNANRWMPPYYDVDINRYEYEVEKPESNYRNDMRGGRGGRNRGGRQARNDMDMEGGDDMQTIGFERGAEMRMGSDASMPRYQEMDRMGGSHAQSGGAKFQRQPKFDEQMAVEWTSKMKNADGTTGPHWSMEQLEAIMKNKKTGLDPVEFFATVNMIYSDYGEVIKKRNLGMDFYVDMAKAFLNDADAGADDKLAAYYEYVVKG